MRKIIKNPIFLSCVFGFWLLNTINISAGVELKPAPVFSDHMVLQCSMPVSIWGEATPESTVKVKFGQQLKVTVAGSDGSWMVRLNPLNACCDPEKMFITCESDRQKKEIVFQDILVGEVWFCSGQSNMAFKVSNVQNADKEIVEAAFPEIRHSFRGEKWSVCSSETVKTFSATAYFFGRELYQNLKIPIGLINSSVGGTPIEYWIPEKVLMQLPYAKKMYAKCNTQQARKWTEEDMEVNRQYKEKVREWAKANKEGENPGPRPRRKELHQDYVARITYMEGNPGSLYRKFVKPVIPYAIRGVIWYQGERNSGMYRGYFYRYLLPLLIKSWRENWNEGKFPFLYVQLPNYRTDWSVIRDSMLEVLNVPNTAMAVTIDLGDFNDIHPKNKQDVGKRLALLARKLVYNQNIVAEGPFYEEMHINDSRIILHFKNTANGLVTRGNELKEFEIAGKDRNFIPAKARITAKDKVEVFSESVSEPVAVRYCWKNNPEVTLYNSSGLPACPFRTDTWPLPGSEIEIR
jgi:sialate O-acetylesterase